MLLRNGAKSLQNSGIYLGFFEYGASKLCIFAASVVGWKQQTKACLARFLWKCMIFILFCLIINSLILLCFLVDWIC